MTQYARAAIGVAALIGLGFALGMATDRLWLAREAPAPRPGLTSSSPPITPTPTKRVS